jgi:hypothetical protein
MKCAIFEPFGEPDQGGCFYPESGIQCPALFVSGGPPAGTPWIDDVDRVKRPAKLPVELYKEF